MAKRQVGEATRFLSALYGETGGLVEVRVKDHDGDIVTREFCNTFATVEKLNDRHGARAQKNAIYFGVGKRTSRTNGKKENVASVPALWADIDINKLSALGWSFETTVRAFDALPGMLQPSALVHSGGGLHAYWFLDTPHDLTNVESEEEWHAAVKKFETVCKMFQGHMGSDMVWDVSRVLRLPGSFNARSGKMARIIWCYHWHRHALSDLADMIAEFDLYLGPAGFVTKDELPQRVENGLDHKRALELNWEETGRGWQKRYDGMWEGTRLGGGYPFIGLDDAQLRATAILYSYNKDNDDVIVERVLRKTMDIKRRDAPNEHWDMDEEARKIKDKLDRWVPKWDFMEKQRAAEKRRLAKEAKANEQ